jgi:CyaY protein
MNEIEFDKIARDELRYIEEQLMDIDPDDIEVSSSDGVLTLDLRDGTRIVVNSHRAARQIWMAGASTAWHFDHSQSDGKWRTPGREPAELRETLAGLIHKRIGLAIPLS